MTTTNYLYPVNNQHVDRCAHVLRCNLRHAWKFTTGDQSVGVAIGSDSEIVKSAVRPADGGVGNVILPEYQDEWFNVPDFMDGYSHGTGVYGALKSAINTGVGVPGSAPGCKTLAVHQCLNTVAEAQRALDNGARVFSMSVTAAYTPTAEQASVISLINAAGGLVVLAVGDGPAWLTSTTNTFATLPGVICVGGSGDAFKVYDTPWSVEANASGGGPAGPRIDLTMPCFNMLLPIVNLVAPGTTCTMRDNNNASYTYTASGISDNGTTYDQMGGPGPNYGYDTYWQAAVELNGQIRDDFTFVDNHGFTLNFDGPDPSKNPSLSFGLPFLAGILGLVWSANPALTGPQVKQIVFDTKNRGKHKDYAAHFPNAGIPDAGKAVKCALSTRADHANAVMPYLGFSGPGVSVSTVRGVGASGVGTMRLQGDVWLDVTGFVNGDEVKQVELLVNGVRAYFGSPFELHFPSATAGTNLLTVRAYAGDGSYTEETYSDVLVGSLGTLTNLTDTTTTYHAVPSFAKTQAYYNQRHNLTHAWKYTTGSKSVKVAMANINDPSNPTYRPTYALYPAPDYTYDCDAGTTALTVYEGESPSHGDAVYSVFASNIAPGCYNLILQSLEPAARLAKAVQLGVNIITDSDGTDTDGPDAAGQASLQSFVTAAAAAVNAGVLYFQATDDNSGYNPMAPLQAYYDADNHLATGQMDWAATAPGVQQVGHAGGPSPSYAFDTPWPGASHALPVVPGSIPATDVWGYGPGMPFTSPGLGVWANNRYVNGTSFSTPVVAGCAALVWSANPALNRAQVLGILNQTKAAGLHADYKTIYPKAGFVDAGRGVKMALASVPANAGVVFPYIGVTGPSVTLTYGGTPGSGYATLTAQGTVAISVGGYCNVSGITNTSCANTVKTVELWANGKRVYRGAPAVLQYTGLSAGTYPVTVVAETVDGLVARETYTDVLVPDLPAARIIPIVTAFSIPATSTSRTVSITSFTAIDSSGVTGYRVTTTATPPLASDPGWTSSPPTTITFPTWGSVTAYAWAKNDSGGVSDPVSASAVLTQLAPTAPVWYYITPGPGQLDCHWNPSPAADSYNVYYSQTISAPGNDAAYPAVCTPLSGKIIGIPAGTLSTVLTGLAIGTFGVYVAAVNSAGSAWSGRYQATVTLAGSAPTASVQAVTARLGLQAVAPSVQRLGVVSIQALAAALGVSPVSPTVRAMAAAGILRNWDGSVLDARIFVNGQWRSAVVKLYPFT